MIFFNKNKSSQPFSTFLSSYNDIRHMKNIPESLSVMSQCILSDSTAKCIGYYISNEIDKVLLQLEDKDVLEEFYCSVLPALGEEYLITEFFNEVWKHGDFIKLSRMYSERCISNGIFNYEFGINLINKTIKKYSSNSEDDDVNFSGSLNSQMNYDKNLTETQEIQYCDKNLTETQEIQYCDKNLTEIQEIQYCDKNLTEIQDREKVQPNQHHNQNNNQNYSNCRGESLVDSLAILLQMEDYSCLFNDLNLHSFIVKTIEDLFYALNEECIKFMEFLIYFSDKIHSNNSYISGIGSSNLSNIEFSNNRDIGSSNNRLCDNTINNRLCDNTVNNRLYDKGINSGCNLSLKIKDGNVNTAIFIFKVYKKVRSSEIRKSIAENCIKVEWDKENLLSNLLIEFLKVDFQPVVEILNEYQESEWEPLEVAKLLSFNSNCNNDCSDNDSNNEYNCDCSNNGCNNEYNDNSKYNNDSEYNDSKYDNNKYNDCDGKNNGNSSGLTNNFDYLLNLCLNDKNLFEIASKIKNTKIPFLKKSAALPILKEKWVDFRIFIILFLINENVILNDLKRMMEKTSNKELFCKLIRNHIKNTY